MTITEPRPLVRGGKVPPRTVAHAVAHGPAPGTVKQDRPPRGSAHRTIAPRASAPRDTVTDRARAVLFLLFTVFLALLVWAVMWKFDLPWVGDGGSKPAKLVPFVATEHFGPSAPREVLANALLFLPFGLYVGALAGPRDWWRAVSGAAMLSLMFEIGQYVLGIGSADTTDLLMNTAGATLGVGLWAALRTMTGERRAALLVIGTGSVASVMAVLLSVFVFSSPMPGMPGVPGLPGAL